MKQFAWCWNLERAWEIVLECNGEATILVCPQGGFSVFYGNGKHFNW